MAETFETKQIDKRVVTRYLRKGIVDEKEFAAYCGNEQGIGVNTGTSALHMALLAAGVGPDVQPPGHRPLGLIAPHGPRSARRSNPALKGFARRPPGASLASLGHSRWIPGTPMDRLLAMKVFLRVSDEGGFAAAARAMDLSPAAVTRLVADLERHLGVRLLNRNTRRVALTQAGAAYLERVRPLLRDLDEAEALASAHTRELSGELRIAASPALATHVLDGHGLGHDLEPALGVHHHANEEGPVQQDGQRRLHGREPAVPGRLALRER